MRRLLAIVLLAFLPLQFSWAAVATYCEHETRIGTGHVGHHEHVHSGSTDADPAPSGDASKVPGSPDLDCGQCAAHHAGVPMRAGASLLPTSGGHPDRAAAETVAMHPSARPERPQWARLA